MQPNVLLKTLIAIVVLYITGLSNKANADLPLEELWSIELDSAVALGSVWMDENDNVNILVADGSYVTHIVDGEGQWRTDGLRGYITALSYIPYTSGHQFIVSVVEDYYEDWNPEEDTLFAWIYRFDSEESEILDSFVVGDLFSVPDLEIDSRYVADIEIFTGMLNQELHPVIILNQVTLVQCGLVAIAEVY